METLQPVLDGFKNLGLDASLYSAALISALLLRFARAYWKWCNGGHTLGLAIAEGAVGSYLVLSLQHSPWQAIAMQGLGLSVCVLVAERVLRGLAGKVPGLPADNEWVTPPATPQPDGGSK